MAKRDDPLDTLTDAEAAGIRAYLKKYAADPRHHALVRYLHGRYGSSAYGGYVDPVAGEVPLEEWPPPPPANTGVGRDPTPSYELMASSPEEVSKRLYARDNERLAGEMRRAWNEGARPPAGRVAYAKDPEGDLVRALQERQKLIIGKATRDKISYDQAAARLNAEVQGSSVMRYARSRPPAPRTPEEYARVSRAAITLASNSQGRLGYDEALAEVLAGL
jgi:hypothetical protein